MSVVRAEARDAIFPVMVVVVIGIMLFPLPLIVLDSLLVFNISFAILLLVSVVYLSEPQRFTSLPTILLFTTLFRLSLNISTTRQILSTGEAPATIASFGNFVVQGNIFVGLVLFSIITIVQFLVIAKGAERIAEVAARFTLDAMPGKQMSIDADVRAGSLSLTEAKVKRRELQTESRLYGALDGAMKFVKGDAIAGVLITFINMGAGFIIGTTQLGLSLGDAAKQFSLFTIGDGLVSQIPALVVTVAAGIAVTRVQDSEGQYLGRDLFSQLSCEPQALITSALVLFLLAVVPGLSFIPFVVIGLTLLTIAFSISNTQEILNKHREYSMFKPKVTRGVTLVMGPEAYSLVQGEGVFPEQLQLLRSGVYAAKGLIVPTIQIEVKQLEQENTMDVLCIYKGEILGTIAIHQDEQEVFTIALFAQLQKLLFLHCEEFLDDTHTRMLLEIQSEVAEDLINDVIPEHITITALTTILRELAQRGLSIREVPTILQAVAEFRLAMSQGRYPELALGALLHKNASTPASSDLERVALIADIRVALKRSISRAVRASLSTTQVWTISSELDFYLSKTLVMGELVDPLLAQRITDAVNEPFSAATDDSEIVVVTSKWARIQLEKLLVGDIKRLQILSVDEVSVGSPLAYEREIEVSLEDTLLPLGHETEESTVKMMEH